MRGVIDMTLGNLFSTIPGILIVALVASSAFTLPALGLTGIAMCMITARMFARDLKVENPKAMATWLSFGLCIALLVSVVAFSVVESSDPAKIGNSIPTAAYWGIKIVATFFGVCAMLIISVVFEACAIFGWRRKSAQFVAARSLDAIIRANVVALFLGALGGALYTLPQRFGTHGFLYLP